MCWSSNAYNNAFYAGSGGCLSFTGNTNDLPGAYQLRIIGTIYTEWGVLPSVDLATLGVHYYLRVSPDSNSCVPVDTSAIMTACALNQGVVADAMPSMVCPGESMGLQFYVTGSYNPGNIFTAQLSDASGSFNSPITIGTSPGNNSGNIYLTIPQSTLPGSAYRVRIISTDPVVSSYQPGNYFVITAAPASPVLNVLNGPCLGSGILNVPGAVGVNTLNWYFNNSLVRSMVDSPLIPSTVAGGNGPGNALNQFNLPYGLFVDGSGYIYVADPSNNRVMRFPPNSTSFTNGVIVAGGNGAGNAANQLDAPYFIYVDSSDDLYVSDCNNYRVQKFPAGSNSTTNGVTVAGGNGSGSNYNQLGFPRGIVVDAAGNLYVADKDNNRVARFPAGSNSSTNATIVAGGNGPGSQLNQMIGPRGICLDANNNLYVADYSNSRVEKFAAGSDSTSYAVIVAGGNGYGFAVNQLTSPYGVFVDASGYLFVADVYNNRIQKFPPGSVSHTPGITVAGGNGPGGDDNQLNEPTEVFVDATGSVLVCDFGNDRIQKYSQNTADTTYIPLVSGVYTSAFVNEAGCVSPPSNAVNINPALYSTISQVICAGNSFEGRSQPGIYLDTLTASSGCDSIRTLFLSVNQGAISQLTQTICAGESYLGRNASGIYTDTLQGVNGCDSVRTLFLTVEPPRVAQLAQTICFGESYMGRSVTGVFTDTLTAANGCDSIRTLNLTVNPLLTSTLTQTICFGESYLGRSETGVFTDTLTSFNGCDSIRTLNLTVNPLLTYSISQTICGGGSYLGHSADGVYTDTLTATNGCDSIRTLNLTVTNVLTSSIGQAICAGGNYSFNGRLLTTAGNYSDTLTSVFGCDSVITLALTVNDILQTAFSDTFCPGGVYVFNGRNIYQSGWYQDTLQSVNGCDSLVRLNLLTDNIVSPVISRFGDTLATGGIYASYQWMLNNEPIPGDTQQSIALLQNGNYRVVVTNSRACDDTSAIWSVLGLGTANVTADDVKLFPNPNAGSFTLWFADALLHTITITDAEGRTIVTGQVEKQKHFEMDKLAAGIYFLQYHQNGLQTLKFSVVW